MGKVKSSVQQKKKLRFCGVAALGKNLKTAAANFVKTIASNKRQLIVASNGTVLAVNAIPQVRFWDPTKGISHARVLNKEVNLTTASDGKPGKGILAYTTECSGCKEVILSEVKLGHCILCASELDSKGFEQVELDIPENDELDNLEDEDDTESIEDEGDFLEDGEDEDLDEEPVGDDLEDEDDIEVEDPEMGDSFEGDENEDLEEDELLEGDSLEDSDEEFEEEEPIGDDLDEDDEEGELELEEGDALEDDEDVEIDDAEEGDSLEDDEDLELEGDECDALEDDEEICEEGDEECDNLEGDEEVEFDEEGDALEDLDEEEELNAGGEDEDGDFYIDDEGSVDIDLVDGTEPEEGDMCDVEYSASMTGSKRWIASVNNLPVAYATLATAGNNKEIFHTEAFGKVAKEVMAKSGIAGLKTIGFTSIVISAPVKGLIQASVNAEISKSEAAYTKQLKTLATDYQTALGMAAAGINRGFFGDVINPLKVRIWEELSSLGIPQPHRIIDRCFKETAESFCRVLIEKASELQAKPVEIRAELSKAITGSNYLAVAEDGDDEDNDDVGEEGVNEEIANRIEASSMPFGTRQASTVDEVNSTVAKDSFSTNLSEVFKTL